MMEIDRLDGRYIMFVLNIAVSCAVLFTVVTSLVTIDSLHFVPTKTLAVFRGAPMVIFSFKASTK